MHKEKAKQRREVMEEGETAEAKDVRKSQVSLLTETNGYRLRIFLSLLRKSIRDVLFLYRNPERTVLKTENSKQLEGPRCLFRLLWSPRSPARISAREHDASLAWGHCLHHTKAGLDQSLA